MSRRLGFAGLVCALILQYSVCWAVYGVRTSDLGNSPTPPNPIKVWGCVTSESPLKISDGRAEVAVSGPSASVGDYLVLTGDWDGAVLTVKGPSTAFMGPARSEMIWIPEGSFLMGALSRSRTSHRSRSGSSAMGASTRATWRSQYTMPAREAPAYGPRSAAKIWACGTGSRRASGFAAAQ